MKARNSTTTNIVPCGTQRLDGLLVYYDSLLAFGQERADPFVGCASYSIEC